MMYRADFADGWDKYFQKLDKSVQIRVWKKVLQIKAGLPARHLEHGVPYFVEDVGQYRICYHQLGGRVPRSSSGGECRAAELVSNLSNERTYRALRARSRASARGALRRF